MSTAEHSVISPKKLIEVALPLDAINAASAREKSIRHGHPSTLHLWWARRPLATARAVIFSQLVNDPEDLWWHQNPGVVPNQQVRGHWTKARQRLFKIIEELVLWENTTNEEVLERAREEIRKSWREVCELNKNHPQAAELFDAYKMPGLHDPFAGGGAIPLEAQRLGLEAYASDLNPVAVLINKAMIEIPPKFAGRPPVHPDARNDKKLFAKEWKGAEGLAEDVRRYGQWMRGEAEKRIGHLYPKVEVTAEMAKERPDLRPLVGQKLTVIAWIWARTVKSPNPAFSDVDVPLASTFILSKKEGHEAYVEVLTEDKRCRFRVKSGTPPASAASGTKSARGANFRCLLSNSPIEPEYIKAEAKAGRMGSRLLAIVAEGERGRVFLSPLASHESTAQDLESKGSDAAIHVPIANDPRALWCLLYGLTHFDHLFTQRQLHSLSTLSNLISEVVSRIRQDAENAGQSVDEKPLADGGAGTLAYAEAIAVYLAFAINKTAEGSSVICTWSNLPTKLHVVSTFGRQALPMAWDYAESNIFAESSGNFGRMCQLSANALQQSSASTLSPGLSQQLDAATQTRSRGLFVSTDPPYYDNIGYADLSDFLYVWLRRSLRGVFPQLLATIAVPKAEELIAAPYRHGSSDQAEAFFLTGMTNAMSRLAALSHPASPVSIYYAFKQADTEGDGTNSTGWETFLGAVFAAGFSLHGTWPMRTERSGGFRNNNQNALASSIILVCRPRDKDAGTISRRQFVRLLNEVLPDALAKMTGADEGDHSPVAPVDLSQAIIGPGMAIFSRYDAVLEADGTPMTVKTALQLINRFLAQDDFDADTQFCLDWFEQYGWETAKFGEADTLARAKGTSVDGVKAAGVIEAGGGNVRLLKWKEYSADWNPSLDTRIPVWEVLHQLIRAYSSKGDAGAAKVLKACAGKAEAARLLAYRLYTLCERRGWAEDARAYNEVVTGWSGIEKAAGDGGDEQRDLFDSDFEDDDEDGAGAPSRKK
jgi:putative DNA methylase